MEWIMGCWVLVGILIGLYWYKKEKKIVKKGRIPQGSTGWPFIGETLDFIASCFTSRPVSFMDKRKSLYGKVFKTSIFGKAVIVSTDPEVNKVVLHNHGSSFAPAYPKSIQELFGKNSILEMNGSLHKRFHTLIGSLLRSPQLKARITKDIENAVKLTLASWKHMQLVYVQHEIKKTTFGILVKVLMSVGHGEDLDFMMREFQDFMKGLMSLPVKLPGTTLYNSLKAKERLLKKVRKIVGERKLVMEKSDEKGVANDAVDVLLRETCDPDETQRLSLDFISAHILELMIPGDETVPTAITLAVKFLSDSPVVLKKLVEENMELKKQKADLCADYTWTDYMSLAFTQNVISETLRLGNIINAVWRKALKDVEIKGYLIPKGWCVLASLISVHMDEENYENPYEFNPWRWEKTGSGVNNICFTPFGGGQRLCPGSELSRLEIAIFLHHFVTTYRWVAKEDEITYFPTVKMKKKLPITVTPIST